MALLFRGLAPDPKVYRCQVTPPKGSVLGCGQHQGPEEAGTQPWGQERLPGEGNIYLGVLKEELTGQEERTFQAGSTAVAEPPRSQGRGGLAGPGRRWGAPDPSPFQAPLIALTPTGSVVGPLCLQRGRSVSQLGQVK